MVDDCINTSDFSKGEAIHSCFIVAMSAAL